MGTEFGEQLIAPVTVPDVAPPQPQSTSFGDELLTESTNVPALQNSIERAKTINPQRAAEIIDLSNKSGLPTQFIEQNDIRPGELPDVDQFDPHWFEKTYPRTAEYLSRDPLHYPALKDDIGFFTRIEGLIDSFAQGTAKVGPQELYSDLQNKEADTGYLTPTEQTQLKELEEQFSKNPPDQSTLNKSAEMSGYFIRQQLSSYGAGAKRALIGGPAGFVAGSAIPGIGNVAGFIGGTAAGFGVGIAEYTYNMERAGAYDTFKRIRDDAGNPLPKDEVVLLSKGVGAVNALIEVASEATIAKLFPGVGSAIGKISKKTVAELVRKSLAAPALRSTMLGIFKKVAEGSIVEGLEEFFQFWVTAGTKYAAKEISGQPFDKQKPVTWEGTTIRFSDEFVKDAKESLQEFGDTILGVAPTLGLSLGGTHSLSYLRQSQIATQAKNTFTALGEDLKTSESFKRLPEKTQEAISAITKDGPVENIYIDRDTWDMYWQEKKIDPRAAVEEVVGDTKQYDAGGTVEIPTSKYATKIAPSQHNQALVEEIRLGSPDKPNAREAGEALRRLKESPRVKELTPEEQAREESVKKVGEAVREQMKGTRMAAQANAYSQLAERRYRTAASAIGMDPFEYYQKYGIKEIRDATLSPEGNALFQTVSPIGFYSQLETAVEQMDFKQIPAKDLMNRIKNLPGIKQDELKELKIQEWLDTQDKVTKEDVLKFIQANTPQLSQTVLGATVGSTEVKWSEEPIFRTVDMEGVFNDIYERHMQEGAKDYYPKLYKKYDKQVSKEITGWQRNIEIANLIQKDPESEDITNKLAEEISEDETSMYVDLTYEEENTGWRLIGNDEKGWFSPETREHYDTNLEEAKIQVQVEMIEKGKLSGSESDFIDAENIEWRWAEHNKEYDTVKRLTTRYFNKNKKELLQQARKKNQTKEQLTNDAMDLAEEEIQKQLLDPKNKKNRITYRVNHPLLKGSSIFGNNVTGWIAKIKDEQVKLTAKNADAAKKEFSKLLIDKKISTAKRDKTLSINEATKPSKFGQYRAKGGENYREILVQYPVKKAEKPDTYSAVNEGGKWFIKNDRTEKFLSDEFYTTKKQALERTEELNKQRHMPVIPIYQGGHFREDNVLVHVRTTDRDNTLFVEEIQSDLHQSADIESKKFPYQQSESWLMLGFKRALGVAVAEGKTYIAWTPGEMQANRYNLSRLVDSISYIKRGEKFEFNIISSSGNPVFLPKSSYEANELDGIFGKNIADQIRGGEGKNASSEENWKRIVAKDLKIGGEGHKYLYNKILPKAVGKYISKLDPNAKVIAADSTDLFGVDLQEKKESFDKVWAVKITDKLAEEVKKGQPLFQSQPTKRGGAQLSEQHLLANEIQKILAANGEALSEQEIKKLLKSEDPKDLARALRAIDALPSDSLRAQYDRFTKGASEKLRIHMHQSVKSTRYPTHGGNVWLTTVKTQDGQEFFGAGDTKQESFEIALSGGLKYESMSIKELFENKTDEGKRIASMLLIGANNFIKSNTPFFFLQKYDVHAFFYPHAETFWKVGFIAVNRTEPNKIRHVIVKSKDVDSALKGGLKALLIDEFAQPEAISDSKSRWLMKWIYSQGKISLRDVLHLDPYEGSKELFQSQPTKLGFFERVQKIIGLLPDANLGTVIHESGHAWLEELSNDAVRENSPQFLRDNLDTVLAWFGSDTRTKDGIDAVRKAITREKHEQFADGFLDYVKKGKAPSTALQKVFDTFSRWLTEIFKLANASNVPLTDDVRAVFDRLLATEEEIAAAEQQQNRDPLFADPRKIGMSEKDAASYFSLSLEAKQDAHNTVFNKLISELTRKQQRFWNEEKEKLKEKISEQVNNEPAQIALSVLRTGNRPDGKEFIEGAGKIKLDKDELVNRYGREKLKELPHGIYALKNGMDLTSAAQLFGYATADELIDGLSKVQPADTVIERLAEQQMLDTYGDILAQGNLANEAMKAIHNEKRSELLRKEIEWMASNEFAKFMKLTKRLLGHVPRQEEIKAQAIYDISQVKIKSISLIAYQRAEAKAAKAALDAYAKGDFKAAIDARLEELLHNERYRAAQEALETVDKRLEYVKKFTKKSKREQLGRTDYLDQIDKILNRFEFTHISNAEADSRAVALSQWISEKQKNDESLGEEIYAGEQILNESFRTNYKNLTFSEFNSIMDTLRQIDKMAIAQDKTLQGEKKEKRADVRSRLIKAITAEYPNRKPFKFTRVGESKLDETIRNTKEARVAMLKMEQVVDWLDGGDITGPWHQFFWNGAADAQGMEYDLIAEVVGKLAQKIDSMPKELKARQTELIKIEGIEQPLARLDLIVAVANMGNESNQSKLMRGMGWEQAQLDEILDHLTKEEMDFVQTVWDTFEELWPQLAAMQKRVTGLEPDRIEIRPLQTKHGEYKGGYYPMIYDHRRSKQGGMQLTSRIGDLTDSGYTRATTPKSATKSRIEEFAAPVNLSLYALPSQIAAMVKDLTHREWLIDANWVINDPEIRKAIGEHMGEEYISFFSDWVKQVINDRNANNTTSMRLASRFLTQARGNLAIAFMGFKASVMGSQLAGFGMVVDVIDSKNKALALEYLGGAYNKFRKNPIKMFNFIIEKSAEMRHRAETKDRDLRNLLRQIENKKDPLSEIQKTSVLGIAYAERLVSFPAWLAAYQKALDENLSEADAIRSGDRAVRLSQGAGGAKDLAGVAARNNELMKLFTMFYTPFSALYNKLADMKHQVTSVKDVPNLLVSTLWVVIFASIMGELLSGRGPDEDKDEDWGTWALKNIALYPFQAIPLVRDVMSAVVQGYGYQFSPLAQVGELSYKAVKDSVNAGVKAWDDDLEEEDLAKLGSSMLKASGVWFGLPTSQLMITGDYLLDLYKGDEDEPDNLTEFFKKLIYRRAKE